jgi:hypothetical protein
LNYDLAAYNPERYFLNSQLCLNLIVNVANVLDSKTNKARSIHLMNFFNIVPEKINNVLNHEMRNTNEHYDERMDALIELSNVELKKEDILDVKKLISTLQCNGVTGFADTDNCILYSINRKLQRISIDLNEVKNELVYIVDQIHKKRIKTADSRS